MIQLIYQYIRKDSSFYKQFLNKNEFIKYIFIFINLCESFKHFTEANWIELDAIFLDMFSKNLWLVVLLLVERPSLGLVFKISFN